MEVDKAKAKEVKEATEGVVSSGETEVLIEDDDFEEFEDEDWDATKMEEPEVEDREWEDDWDDEEADDDFTTRLREIFVAGNPQK
eukprot:CAMPEP_0184745262 /NCGR_PEP_ID=MMETSP0315-20130426/7892_1 /TAXON_ID=101924 /ORGANISM="Rhodosorus marinus, Strain UTEX LB 2760" /LENGTH=84 /DNA_ID=CAMNT_0027217285 /DNA_START=134 /DNA_END=388 /DNA_ORIENTATION=-